MKKKHLLNKLKHILNALSGSKLGEKEFKRLAKKEISKVLDEGRKAGLLTDADCNISFKKKADGFFEVKVGRNR